MSDETKQPQVPSKFCDGLNALIRGIGHVVMWATAFALVLRNLGGTTNSLKGF